MLTCNSTKYVTRNLCTPPAAHKAHHNAGFPVPTPRPLVCRARERAAVKAALERPSHNASTRSPQPQGAEKRRGGNTHSAAARRGGAALARWLLLKVWAHVGCRIGLWRGRRVLQSTPENRRVWLPAPALAMAPAEILSGKVVSAYVPSSLPEGGGEVYLSEELKALSQELSLGVCFLLAPSNISPGTLLVVVRHLCAEIGAQADATRWNHCLLSVYALRMLSGPELAA